MVSGAVLFLSVLIDYQADDLVLIICSILAAATDISVRHAGEQQLVSGPVLLQHQHQGRSGMLLGDQVMPTN
jgi:hypothetical protein